MGADCARYDPWIARGGSGLSASEAAELASHLTGCEDCRSLAQMLDTAAADDVATYEQLPDLASVDVTLYARVGALGSGGMGETYLAFERRLGRTVVVKELRSDREPGRYEPLFEREARLSARLQHPSIVSIYEAGRFGPGRPFYAMRLVDGRSLLEEIAARDTLAERLALVGAIATVAQAIAYAHERRIVHRDLKPANIVLGRFGEVVVIDWGLAIDLDEPGRGVATSGTPAYMPPEQALGEPADEGVDIYALGATLYHVLAGEPPYADARRPIDALLAGPPRPLPALAEGAPRDLLAICAKAMARDRGGRYATAGQLADDLTRFLAGRLVDAYEYGRAERVVRFVRRHRLPLAVAAIGLAVSATIATVSIRRIIEAREVAQARADELVLGRARDQLDRDPTASLAWLAQYPAGGPGAREGVQIAAEAASRGVARHVLVSNTRFVNDIAVSSDDRWIASAGADATVRLWDARTSDERVLARGRTEMTRVAFSPDGTKLAAGGSDGSLRWWDVASGSEHALDPSVDAIDALAWSHDGRLIATGGRDRQLRVTELPSGAVRDRATGWDIFDVAFSPDDRLVVAGGRLHGDQPAVLWDMHGDLQPLAGAADVFSVAFADGGAIAIAARTGVCVWEPPYFTPAACARTNGVVRRVVTSGDQAWFGAEDGSVYGWKWRAQPAPVRLGIEPGAVVDEALAPDGTHLVTGTLEGVVRVWDLVHGGSTNLLGHRDVSRVAVGKQLIASTGIDHAVRVWSLGTAIATPLPGLDAGAQDVVWSGDRIVALGTDGTAHAWDGRALTTELTASVPVGSRRIARVNDAVVVVGGDSKARVLDLATGHETDLVGHENEVFAQAALPDGRLVTGGIDGEVLVWNGATPHLLARHRGGVWALAIAPDGAHVASAGFDGTVHYSDIAGTSSVVIGQHAGHINALAIAGTHVVSGGTDEAIGIWPTDGSGSGTLVHLGDGQITDLVGLDAQRIVAGTRAGAVHAVTIDGADRIVAQHRRAVTSVAVSPDHQTVASTSLDGTVRIFDAAGTTPHVFLAGGPVRRVAFSPGGDQLAIASTHVEVLRLAALAAEPATTTAQITPPGTVATPERSR